MCESVTSFYACRCAAENQIHKCKQPGLKCIERLQTPKRVSIGASCPHHTPKLEPASMKTQKNKRSSNYPPSSFTQNNNRRQSHSQLSRGKANRTTVSPRTSTSADPLGRRASTSSSIYTKASVTSSIQSQSARPRAESYAQLLDLDSLSLEQSTALAEAHATLGKSIELDDKRRATEAAIFDSEVAPALLQQSAHRIKQTILRVVEHPSTQSQSTPNEDILSPRTANTHPALRDQLSPRKPATQTRRDDILSPATVTRNASMKAKAARIRASLDREHISTAHPDLDARRASATATTARKPGSPIRKREYRSWAARPSHTSTARYADRPPPAPPSAHRRAVLSRQSYDEVLEGDLNGIWQLQLSEREKYELFLEKDRQKTAAERARRAERNARGGLKEDLREKSDGICSVM